MFNALKNTLQSHMQQTHPAKKWPNAQTACTLASIATIVAGIAMKNATLTIAGITMKNSNWPAAMNAPARLLSLGAALYQKRFYKIAFDISAFTFLLCPQTASLGINLIYFRVAAIGIDLLSEGYNFYHSEKKINPLSAFSSSKPRIRSAEELASVFLTRMDQDLFHARPEPTNPDEARELFFPGEKSISFEDFDDYVGTVLEIRDKFVKESKCRQVKLTSKPIYLIFQKLIDRMNISAEFLLKEYIEKSILSNSIDSKVPAEAHKILFGNRSTHFEKDYVGEVLRRGWEMINSLKHRQPETREMSEEMAQALIIIKTAANTLIKEYREGNLGKVLDIVIST